MEMEEMILLKEITIFDLNKIIPGTKVRDGVYTSG